MPQDVFVIVLLLYFLWNRSTRPAVSTSFCLPVKKGWHFEQISRWISGLVDRVLNVSPHAHLTVASTYSGCMFAFISLRLLMAAPCRACVRSRSREHQLYTFSALLSARALTIVLRSI